MSSIDDVITKINALQLSIGSVHDRLQNVETSINTHEERIDNVHEKIHATLETRGGEEKGLYTSGPSGALFNSYQTHSEKRLYSSPLQADAEDTAAEIQQEFEQIKEGFSKVKLPSELKVYHNATGVTNDTRPAYNILKECVSYGETAAKWIARKSEDLDKDPSSVVVTAHELHELFTIIYAQQNFLKSEYTTVIVKSANLDEDTNKFFRLFERHPTCFSEKTMKHLSYAADLAVIKAKSQNHTGRRGGNNYSRGGPRRGGGFGRSTWQPSRYNRDYSDTYQGKYIPPKGKRPQGANQSTQVGDD